MKSKQPGDRIEAETVVVEVIDRHTGQTYRRTLPVKYLETCNGVILEGETLDGKPTEIAFLSETALDKIRDLFGKGADAPRCGGTGDHQ